jgi:hypothetical protein
MPVEDLGELRALRRTGLQIDLNPLIAVWESCKRVVLFELRWNSKGRLRLTRRGGVIPATVIR